MHRRRPSLSIPLPNVDAGWLTNLVVIAGLLAVCLAVAFLTDWRWGLLTVGCLAVVSGVYVQRNLPDDESRPAEVTQIRRRAG